MILSSSWRMMVDICALTNARFASAMCAHRTFAQEAARRRTTNAMNLSENTRRISDRDPLSPATV
jgi:hypothetical protein